MFCYIKIKAFKILKYTERFSYYNNNISKILIFFMYFGNFLDQKKKKYILEFKK